MIRRTAVNQAPGGGTIYPFTEVTELNDVVLDAYVCYDDDQSLFELPFSLEFTNTGSTFTVALLDAAAVNLIEFTDAEAVTTDWGTERRVYEWSSPQFVLRLVIRYGELVGNFADTVPLDPRTCNRMASRVRSLNGLSGTLILQAGYNINLAVTETPGTDGGRRTSRVVVSAIPGAGLGRRTGCEDTVATLKTINGQGPAPGGNFKIVLDDCYRSQLALTMVDTPQSDPVQTVRQAVYRYPGLTDEDAQAAIMFFNDCRPCCSCDDYVRVYKGLKAMWDRWKTVAQEAEEARDMFAANRDRWLSQKSCREDNPVHTVAQSLTTCRVFLGANYCNVTKCCLTNIEIRLTVQLFENGEPIDWVDSTVTDAYIETSYTDSREPYVPIRDGSVFRFFIDYANPGDSTIVAMRLCVACQPDPTNPDPPLRSIRVTVTVHVPDPPDDPDGNPCVLPEKTVADDILDLWSLFSVPATPAARALDASKDVPLDPNLPVSPGCCNDCEG